jgi:hypothetical protein
MREVMIMADAGVSVDFRLQRQGAQVEVRPCVHAETGQRLELHLRVSKQGPSGRSVTRQSQSLEVKDNGQVCAGRVRNSLQAGDRVAFEIELWREGDLLYRREETVDSLQGNE